MANFPYVHGEQRPAASSAPVDFFVSYTGADEAWATWVAEVLEQTGRSVRVRAWDLLAGENSVFWISEQMAAAGRTIVLCSPAYFDARRRTSEWTGAMVRRKLILLRAADCELPDILLAMSCQNLHGVDETVARQRLLEAAGAAPDRVSDGFPGRPASVAESGPRVAFPGRLPEIFTVPARLRHFTGRQDLLDQMRVGLATSGPVAVTALHGLGGVGKTQLAVEYAHRHAADYQTVIWVDAEEAELIPTGLAQHAGRLGLPATGRVIEDAEAVRDALRHRDRWLLVYDNAENPTALRPWLVDGDGHILITSRHTGWGGLAESIEIDVMTRPDAVDLLVHRIPGLDGTLGDRLAEELGDLPLALEQAAAYIDTTRTPAADYLTRFRAERAGMLTKGTDLAHGGRIATLWKMTIDRLDPAAVRLLNLCACLGPEPIPLGLFRHPIRGRWRARRVPLLSAGELRDAVDTVVAYSLVRRTGDSLIMHRLLAAVIRARDANSTTTATATRALLVAAKPEDFEPPDLWPAWAALLPQILTAPALHPDRPEPDIGRAARWLLIDTVHYLITCGDYRSAAALGRILHVRSAAVLGAVDLDRLSADNAAALSWRCHGDYEAARALDEDTLDRCVRRFGVDAPQTLSSASSLAADLRGLGEYQDARALDEDTLARRRRRLGENHPNTLDSADSLAADLRALGDNQAALVLDQDVLARRRRVLGDDHPHTLSSASSVAADLRGLGEYQAARVLDEDTLARRRRRLGEDHPNTLDSANDLVTDLRALGDLVGAEEIEKECRGRRNG